MSGALQRFDEIYRRKQWASAGVLSGDGSRTVNNGQLIEWLDQCAAEGLRSVIDLGCGDLEWISNCGAITEGLLHYTGYDILPTMIEHHRRVFPWFNGMAADLEEIVRTAALSADIVILKDVLPHHCNGFCEQMLKNVSRATWRRFVVTSHPGAHNASRRNVRGARWVPYDVEATGILGEATQHLPRSEGVYAVYHR